VLSPTPIRIAVVEEGERLPGRAGPVADQALPDIGDAPIKEHVSFFLLDVGRRVLGEEPPLALGLAVPAAVLVDVGGVRLAGDLDAPLGAVA
jgi:hypothetical protein